MGWNDRRPLLRGRNLDQTTSQNYPTDIQFQTESGIDNLLLVIFLPYRGRIFRDSAVLNGGKNIPRKTTALPQVKGYFLLTWPELDLNLGNDESQWAVVATSGTDISTSPLAPASKFLKKGLSGKYILVFTCPNGQADSLNTKNISFIVHGPNIPRNMQTMQQNRKENGFQIFQSMINNTCFSSICYNLFWASQKLTRASQIH